jgi:hypothetical protein
MESGARRALSTLRSPLKSLVGKSQRAQAQREMREARASRATRKDGEGV